MFDLLWTLRGSVGLGQVPEGDVLQRVRRLLDHQHKQGVEVERGRVAFRMPLWSITPNWFAMAIYNRGDFRIERYPTGLRLSYALNSLDTLLLCLAGSVASFVMSSLGLGFLAGAKVALAALSWLYGVNLLLAWVRVPLLISGAVMKP